MFNRLNRIDLPGRLDRMAPTPLIRILVTGVILLAVMGVREAIDAVAPGVAPFALLFPAVLVATLLAGWMSGAAITAMGGVIVWRVVMRHAAGFGPAGEADTVSLALYFISAGAIVVVAEAFRLSARTLAGGQAALKASEDRLELATAAASVGVWEWRLQTNEMIYSPEARAICGFPAEGPLNFDMVAEVTHPDDFPRTSAQAQRALDPAVRDETPYEYRLKLPDGTVRWVTANGKAIFETVDGQEVAIRYVGTIQDITARKAAEAERDEQAARLRLAIDAGRMAVWQIGGRRGVTPNPELNRILGFPDDARPSLDEINALYLPGEAERVREVALAALARSERHFEVEYQVRRPDGEVRWLMARAELLMDEQGQSRSAIGVVMDVTERKSAEEVMRLLAREVDHRANNLLTVVLGTVQLSQAETPEALREVLTGRIAALGRAHQLLSEARWEGADLRRLVEEELLAFSLGEAARVSLSGPDVALSPPAAQALAMALHELATNAAKYGSLSKPEGRVSVSWTRNGQGPLALRWEESGGPRVAKPSRRGLGTAMLARALAGPLGGSSRLDWRAEGLVCELELPGQALEAAGAVA
ncbi:PAS domain-containing protein [Phenylobacterium sp.]|uniref:PAS domain-containing protein n=1 Tax=Phenylobacterium sp. TaxID=1871053 RepID=UPI002F3F36BB